MDRDGECFHRFFPQDDGILAVRFVEPEYVRDRAGDTGEPTESFGVETYPLDLETILAYWIVANPYRNQFPDRVPSEDILHLKLNVDMVTKRGVPTFYPIEGNLRRAEELQASMVAMAKARAKIALIRKLQGTTRSAAENLINSVKTADVTDPATGQQISLERMRYGTILTSNDKVEYEFPNHNTDASGYIEILQSELRACAARLNMPEWMLSASTSDANYATALVAEAPSVKSFERIQRTLAQAFGESKRPGAKMSALWRQINHSVRVGRLPIEVLKQVDIQVECPLVTARDKQAEATINQTYNTMGIKSKHTIASELGLDYDQEQQLLEKEGPSPEEMAMQQSMVPGVEGDMETDQPSLNEEPLADEGAPGTSPRSTTSGVF
jgi:CYTH domain-containing protein